MNKTIFTLAAALLTSVGAAAVTVPFTSGIAEGEHHSFVDGWSESHNSRRGNIFTYDNETNDGKGVYHRYDADYAADTWMISPNLELTAGTEYTITFETKTRGTDSEKFEAYIATAGTISDLKAGTLLMRNTAYAHASDFETQTVKFTPETSGDYYFGMHCFSDANSYDFYFHSFSITDGTEGGGDDGDEVTVPALVNDLAVAADGTDELLVSLSWTMPAVDKLGNPLSGKLTYEVYRNGEPLKSDEAYAGAFTATIDEPAEAGVYEYYVVVSNAKGADETTPEAVSAGYVGKPMAELTQGKWELDFFSDDAITLITVEDADADGATFAYAIGYGYYDRYYEVARASYADEIDDYFCSPYFALAPGYYRLTVTSKSPANGFALGTVTNRHAQAATFSPLLTVAAEEVTESNQQFSAILIVEEAGDYALAVHGFGPGNSNNTALRIGGLSIESIVRIANAPVNLTVSAGEDDAAKAIVSWFNPALDNAGLELTDNDLISAVIKLNGVEVKTVENLKREQQCSAEIEVSEAAEIEVSVELLLNGNGGEESTATVFCFLGEALQVPYVVTDFTPWTTMTEDWGYYPWVKTDDNALSCDAEWSFQSAHALSEFVELKSGKSYIVEIVMTNAHESADCELALNISGSLKEENLSKMTEIGRFTTEAKTLAPKTHTLTINSADVIPGKYVFGLKTLSKGKPTVTSFSVKEDTSSAIGDVTAPLRRADNAFYDLQGRRVITPRPGQLLIHNGAKLLHR